MGGLYNSGPLHVIRKIYIIQSTADERHEDRVAFPLNHLVNLHAFLMFTILLVYPKEGLKGNLVQSPVIEKISNRTGHLN